MSESYDHVAGSLQKASVGFDHLFLDEITDAKSVFREHDSPIHLLGLGVCSFLEASLGLEVRLQKGRSAFKRRSRLFQVCDDGRSERCVEQCRGTGQETTQVCIQLQ